MTTTADDFDQVPTPVADVARGVVAGTATWLDLLRAMWKNRQHMSDEHFVATHLWIDRKFNRQAKGSYHGRWPFLQDAIQALLHAEATQTQPSRPVQREGPGLIQAQIGRIAWTWDPRRPDYTMASLLGEQKA